MSAGTLEMPPFDVLARALRKTTERLAQELAQPADSPPDWSELEWGVARAVVAIHGIAALLANRLRWLGPPSWQAFLEEQRRQSILRDTGVGELLRRIDAATREAQISCVALKGSALHALRLYRPGERPMGDVDLLVRVSDLTAIPAAMRSLDYVEAFRVKRHTVYEPRGKRALHDFGEHVDNPLKIEIHTAVAEPLPVRKVDITDRLWPVQASPGLNAYPSATALFLHLLLHAAGNMRAHCLRLLQLHDLATLASRPGYIEWAELLATSRGTGSPWWMFPPLALTARYFPGSVPDEALRAVRALCSGVLRFVTTREALTDVSLSNLRIKAFPGIAWSRTPFDALRFMRSRVLPSRRALLELDLGRQTQPQLEQVPWYQLSHAERIARWVFSRPPRAQTIVSVRAALERVRQPVR